MRRSVRSLTGITTIRSLLVIAVYLVFCHSGPVLAQNSQPPNPSDSIGADKSNRESNRLVGSIEEEMRAKRAIKYAEKEYRENIDRAREVSTLALQLQQAFKTTKSIDREAAKKLERLEKLTKKLRSEAGGADDEDTLQKPPADVGSAISRIAEVSASLSEEVQKTPRQVVSACIIDQANVLLELIRIVRTLTRTAD